MVKLPSFIKQRESNLNASRNPKKSGLDYTLFSVILGLSIFGSLMVYSGSAIVAVKQGFEPHHYFIRQITWIALGLIGMYLTYKIDYRTVAKLSLPAFIVTIALLILVLFVNEGEDVRRWIKLGPFDLQPSEIAKLTTLIYLSSLLAKHKEVKTINKQTFTEHVKSELLPYWGAAAIVLVLILLERDMDTTLMLGATTFIVYFIAGRDLLHTLGSIITGLLTSIILGGAMVVEKYRLTRLGTFFDFWNKGTISDPYSSGFQFRQILVAVASGGIFGVGFGESRQKYHYLGETAFTDTIFAIFAEEFGLVGCVILVSVFVFIFLKGYKIAMGAKDRLGFLLAISITTWITLQAVLHIGANVALIPINGNTLPFLSYGGSSTVINLSAIGILLNIAKGGSQSEERRVVSLPQRSRPQLHKLRKRR